MNKLEHALSATALSVVVLLLVATCAFARGFADGASYRLRGGCDVEKIHHLKPGYYAQVQR
jgi:hypothetical protein